MAGGRCHGVGQPSRRSLSSPLSAAPGMRCDVHRMDVRWRSPAASVLQAVGEARTTVANDSSRRRWSRRLAHRQHSAIRRLFEQRNEARCGSDFLEQWSLCSRGHLLRPWRAAAAGANGCLPQPCACGWLLSEARCCRTMRIKMLTFSWTRAVMQNRPPIHLSAPANFPFSVTAMQAWSRRGGVAAAARLARMGAVHGSRSSVMLARLPVVAACSVCTSTPRATMISAAQRFLHSSSLRASAQPAEPVSDAAAAAAPATAPQPADAPSAAVPIYTLNELLQALKLGQISLPLPPPPPAATDATTPASDPAPTTPAAAPAPAVTLVMRGWVRSIRASKSTHFMLLNDGTALTSLQCTLDAAMLARDPVLAGALNPGASVEVQGQLVLTYKTVAALHKAAATLPPGSAQPDPLASFSSALALTSGSPMPQLPLVELSVSTVRVIGLCDPASYPMHTKQAMSLEHLREHLHLRARTSTLSAAMRVRSRAQFDVHRFFLEQGFLNVHTPVITPLDCEGAGEVFGQSIAHRAASHAMPRCALAKPPYCCPLSRGRTSHPLVSSCARV